MNLYKNYCYPDSQAVAEAVHSEFTIEGFGIIQTVTPNGDALTITVLTPDLTQQTINYTLQTCNQLGFNQSYTGLTVDDSLLLSGEILFALASVYAIKAVRKAF
ncbi:hypothetical protein JCM14076_15940 [Methylosoma difficile]